MWKRFQNHNCENHFQLPCFFGMSHWINFEVIKNDFLDIIFLFKFSGGTVSIFLKCAASRSGGVIFAGPI